MIKRWYRSLGKRVADIMVSFVLILTLIPFFIVISIVILITSKGPVLFKQERVGKGVSSFVVYKFRTMTDEKREVGKIPIIGKVEGVTNFGHFLRSFKIDELPQLFNVLVGEMSLVGPRPSVRKQLLAMTDNEKRRYEVLPGLTGLAQVSGNIHITWKERYVLDLKYVDNISFRNDVRIFFRTAILILAGEKQYKHKRLKITKK